MIMQLVVPYAQQDREQRAYAEQGIGKYRQQDVQLQENRGRMNGMAHWRRDEYQYNSDNVDGHEHQCNVLNGLSEGYGQADQQAQPGEQGQTVEKPQVYTVGLEQ